MGHAAAQFAHALFEVTVLAAQLCSKRGLPHCLKVLAGYKASSRRESTWLSVFRRMNLDAISMLQEPPLSSPRGAIHA